MLVTKLKTGDILQIGDAQILVGKITGSTVRLSIHAPMHMEIHRLPPLQSASSPDVSEVSDALDVLDVSNASALPESVTSPESVFQPGKRRRRS
jgi:sRNA-binding carbon storage regulator CsrA